MRTGAALLSIGNLLMGVAYWEAYGKVDGFTLWLAVCAVSFALIALRIVRDRELERAERFFMTAPDEYGFVINDEQEAGQETER